MSNSEWALTISIAAVLITSISVIVAYWMLRQSRWLQQEQWRREEVALRRDVLRRLFAYRYRLTESLKGRDGEPFVALNEAWIVYADFPQVTEALTRMHNELGIEGRLSPNIVALVRAMAEVTNVSVHDLDDNLIERPFTFPANAREP